MRKMIHCKSMGKQTATYKIEFTFVFASFCTFLFVKLGWFVFVFLPQLRDSQRRCKKAAKCLGALNRRLEVSLSCLRLCQWRTWSALTLQMEMRMMTMMMMMKEMKVYEREVCPDKQCLPAARQITMPPNCLYFMCITFLDFHNF